ncbi:hypothetical protein TeGR_g11007 [Tetraparma gracilis]|uniref:Uncharacterized protein n=1 Tax=Tetraparma gracilis TaxID=2962635 RepID=A0ABQ6MWF4_9STRA|nr:hypothetical protein TeGR_g11007 [Tetraparma gracilis]
MTYTSPTKHSAGTRHSALPLTASEKEALLKEAVQLARIQRLQQVRAQSSSHSAAQRSVYQRLRRQQQAELTCAARESFHAAAQRQTSAAADKLKLSLINVGQGHSKAAATAAHAAKRRAYELAREQGERAAASNRSILAADAARRAQAAAGSEQAGQDERRQRSRAREDERSRQAARRQANRLAEEARASRESERETAKGSATSEAGGRVGVQGPGLGDRTVTEVSATVVHHFSDPQALSHPFFAANEASLEKVRLAKQAEDREAHAQTLSARAAERGAAALKKATAGASATHVEKSLQALANREKAQRSTGLDRVNFTLLKKERDRKQARHQRALHPDGPAAAAFERTFLAHVQGGEEGADSTASASAAAPGSAPPPPPGSGSPRRGRPAPPKPVSAHVYEAAMNAPRPTTCSDRSEAILAAATTAARSGPNSPGRRPPPSARGRNLEPPLSSYAAWDAPRSPLSVSAAAPPPPPPPHPSVAVDAWLPHSSMPSPSRAAKPVPVSEVRSRVDGLPSEQEELDGSDEESGGFDGPGDRRPAAEWMEREVAAMERAAAGMAGSPSGARRAPRRADPSDPADFPYGSYESADPRKPASRRADPSDPAEPYADVASDDLRTDPRNYERYIPPSAPGSAIADGSFPGPDDVPASPSRPTLPGSPARVPAPGARGSPAARTDVRRAVKGNLDDMERMVAEFGQHLSDMDAYEEPESSALTAAILPAPSASPAPAPAASRVDTTDQDLSTHTFQTSSDESASPADHPDDSDESAIRRIIAETAALSGSSKSMSASNQTSQPSASSNGSSEDRALEAAAEFLKDLTLDKTREPNASSNASSDAVDAESQAAVLKGILEKSDADIMNLSLNSFNTESDSGVADLTDAAVVASLRDTSHVSSSSGSSGNKSALDIESERMETFLEDFKFTEGVKKRNIDFDEQLKKLKEQQKELEEASSERDEINKSLASLSDSGSAAASDVEPDDAKPPALKDSPEEPKMSARADNDGEEEEEDEALRLSSHTLQESTDTFNTFMTNSVDASAPSAAAVAAPAPPPPPADAEEDVQLLQNYRLDQSVDEVSFEIPKTTTPLQPPAPAADDGAESFVTDESSAAAPPSPAAAAPPSPANDGAESFVTDESSAAAPPSPAAAAPPTPAAAPEEKEDEESVAASTIASTAADSISMQSLNTEVAQLHDHEEQEKQEASLAADSISMQSLNNEEQEKQEASLAAAMSFTTDSSVGSPERSAAASTAVATAATGKITNVPMGADDESQAMASQAITAASEAASLVDESLDEQSLDTEGEGKTKKKKKKKGKGK